MCGIVGFSGSQNFDVTKMQILMLANMTRGMHSTGIFNSGKIIKEADNAVEFLDKHYLIPENIFIGHDRYATIGAKTAKNAHPFEYDGTVLVHNGTLTNHWSILRDNDLSIKGFDVDSHVMTALISKHKKSYKVLQDFEGAAALIWHNEETPNRIYCFRNEDRPLFRGYTDEGMYISSIESSLNLIGCEKIEQFKTNYVYVIEDGVINVKDSKKIFRGGKKKKEKKKNWNKRGHHGGTSGGSTSYSIYDDVYDDKPKANFHNGISPAWIKADMSYDIVNISPNKYYRLAGVPEVTSYFFEVYGNNGKKVTVSKTSFAGRDNIKVGSYVVAMKTSTNGYIKEGVIYYCEAIDFNSRGTIILVVREPKTETAYEWSFKNFRLAEKHEVEVASKVMESAQIEREFDDAKLEKELLEFLEIENPGYFFDLENVWIPASDIYKNIALSYRDLDASMDLINNVMETDNAKLDNDSLKALYETLMGMSSANDSIKAALKTMDTEAKDIGIKK